MAIAVDLIIIAIIAFVVWRSAVRGFVRTIIELVGYILAVILAFTIAGAVADTVYEKSVRPSIINTIETNLKQTTGSTDYAAVIEETWDDIPEYLTSFAEKYGLSKEKLTDKLESSMSDGASNAAEIVTDSVIKPIVVNIITMALSLLLFIVLMIVVRLVAKWLNSLFNVPILGTANTVLGGVTGFVKGGVIVFVIVCLIGVALPVFNNKLWIFTPELIDSTYIFKAIYNLNPLIK